MIQLFIKLINNKTILLRLDSSTNIMDVKEIIQQREGIPVCSQRVIYCGKDLCNEHSLQDYCIQDEGNLTILLSINGGMSGYSQGNNSYSQGNNGYSQGNNSYSQGNNSYSQGNNSYSGYSQGNNNYSGNRQSSYSQGNNSYYSGNGQGYNDEDEDEDEDEDCDCDQNCDGCNCPCHDDDDDDDEDDDDDDDDLDEGEAYCDCGNVCLEEMGVCYECRHVSWGTNNTTNAQSDYDRNNTWTSYPHASADSSPRTINNTASNTADYPRSNRGVVGTYSNWGGTYTSSSSGYNR